MLFGVGAYVTWGLLPLYWILLKPASAAEVLANRFVWSFVFVAIVLLALRRTAWLRDLARRPRVAAYLAIAAALIALNWWTYIYGVNTGRVVETSLGYFINPLVSILLGVLVLGERLRPAQWTAVGIGTAAVVVLAVDYGRLPWIALVLAGTFAVYALLKKKAAAPPLEGMAVESGVSAPFALAYLLWLGGTGHAAFGHVSAGHTALLIASGVATAIPLLLFAGAANRVPLSTLGVLQYIAPTLQFLIGVVALHEAMPAVRWIGFALVWTALAVFTLDGAREHRVRRAALTRQAAGQLAGAEATRR
jgi:chloramphenicol-sensitive protein RarD